MAKKTKILLTAYIGSDNLGDEVIAESLINKLSALRNIEIRVLSKRHEHTKNRIKHENIQIHRYSMVGLYKHIRFADKVVIGGGGLIQDESSLLNLFYYYLISVISKKYNKQTVLMFVGVGPIKTKVGKYLLKKMRLNIDYCLVRDDQSRKILLDHGFKNEHVLSAYDIVFNYGDLSLRHRGKKYDQAILCVRDWFFTSSVLPAKLSLRINKRLRWSKLSQFRRSLLEFITSILEEDKELEIIGAPFYPSQDLDQLYWIRDNLDENLRGRFRLIEEEMSPKLFIKLCSNSRFIVGMRLHSVILASLTGVPVFPIIYSAKVRSVVSQLGLDDKSIELTNSEIDIYEKYKEKAFKPDKHYIKKIITIRNLNDIQLEKTLKFMELK